MQKLRSSSPQQENYRSSSSENSDHFKTANFGNLNELKANAMSEPNLKQSQYPGYQTGNFGNLTNQSANGITKPKLTPQSPLIQKSKGSGHSYDFNRKSFQEKEEIFKKMKYKLNERKN